MTEFSTEARQLLIASGWSEDRRIDISAYERALAAGGYESCAAVSEFLRRYGDLEIATMIDDIGFNTLFSGILTRELVSRFSQDVGMALYTIGECCFEMMDMLMDSSGRVYRYMRMSPQNFGGVDLYRIADTAEEALEKLIVDDTTEEGVKGEWMAHRE